MTLQAGPLLSGTVRELVKKGIHLLCVFFHTLRDGPVTVARSKPQSSFSRIFILLRTYVEFVLEFVIF